MLLRPRRRVLLTVPSISVSDLSQVPWGQHLGPFPHRRPLVWASRGEADGLPGPPHPTAGPAPPRAFSLSPGRVGSRADSTPPLASAAPSTARRPASPRSASTGHCCHRSFAELPPLLAPRAARRKPGPTAPLARGRWPLQRARCNLNADESEKSHNLKLMWLLCRTVEAVFIPFSSTF